MRNASIPVWLRSFADHQPTYLMIALGVAAIFWAITGSAPALAVTLIYSLVLGNATAIVLESVPIPRALRKSSWSWLFSLLLLFALTPVIVTISTAIIFIVVAPAPRGSFWNFLVAAWKFPTVANLIFGTGYLAYRAGKDRLENRNQQLQHVINTDIAERKIDAAELQQAREIQQGLLPKDIPQVAEFEITGAWEPAKVVGGDYYDVIRLGTNKLGICVADVVGKGISAALLMANVQASVRAFASESSSPSDVCRNINSVLCANLASGKFVTLFYGVLDASKRTLHYTNAGHLRPILIASNGSVDHLENGGALLGVFPDWKYEDSTIELNPGDLLLLFTDGITEAMAPDGEEFGEDRLIAAATVSPGQSIHELQSQLLVQVKSFCNSQMSDDATLILIAALGGNAEAKNQALSRDHVREPHREYAGVQP